MFPVLIEIWSASRKFIMFSIYLEIINFLRRKKVCSNWIYNCFLRYIIENNSYNQ